MPDKKQPVQQVSAPGFITSFDEKERLRREIYRSDLEKLNLFTQMLRTNNLLKRAKITHK